MKKIELNVKTGDYYTPVNVKTLAKNVTCTNHFTGETTNVINMIDVIRASRPVTWGGTISFPSSAYFEAGDITCDGATIVVGESKVVNGVRGHGIYTRAGDSFTAVSATQGENIYRIAYGGDVPSPDAKYIATTVEGNGIWQCINGNWSSWHFAPTSGDQYYKPNIACNPATNTYVIAPYEMQLEGQDWTEACDCVFVSVGGTTWDRVELPTPQYMGAITYANGKFIIANTWSDVWYTSVNGTNWTMIYVPLYKEWTRIAYGNGVWTAVAQDDWSDECAIYSEDNGVTWLPTKLPSTGYWRDIAYDGERFVVIKELYNWNYTNTLAASYDGKSWMPILAPSFGSWKAIGHTGTNWILAKGGQTLNALAERYDCQCAADYYSTVYKGE